MNVYFSGSSEISEKAWTDNDPRLLAVAHDHFRLFSCHGSYLNVALKTLEEQILLNGFSHNVELLLDSGAFTAWSKGDEVTLDHLVPIYADIVERYEHKLKAIWLINLDKIPGEKGRTASNEEIIEAMHISDNNFMELCKHFGKRVLPVFHQNEPQEQLLKLAEASSYICVSPRNDLPESARVTWSQEAHLLVPHVKTHGLAATGAHMMATVPWGTVDSATWRTVAAYGGIVIERPRQLRILQISEKSGSIKEWGNHFDNLTPIEQDFMVSRFTEYGFTPDELRTDLAARSLFNRIALIKYGQRYDCKAAKAAQPVQKGIFDL